MTIGEIIVLRHVTYFYAENNLLRCILCRLFSCSDFRIVVLGSQWSDSIGEPDFEEFSTTAPQSR